MALAAGFARRGGETFVRLPRWESRIRLGLERHAPILTGRSAGLLEFEAGEVLAEGRVEDHVFEVDRTGDEGRERPRPIRGPRRFFHVFAVERRVRLFLLGA